MTDEPPTETSNENQADVRDDTPRLWFAVDPDYDEEDSYATHIVEATTETVASFEALQSLNERDSLSTLQLSEQLRDHGAEDVDCLCGRGSFDPFLAVNIGTRLIPVDDPNLEPLQHDSFDADPPSPVCGHCWSKADTLAEQHEERAANGDTRREEDAFRFRFKNTRDPQNIWADVVVGSEVTFDELTGWLHSIFNPFTIGHMEVWGIEEEYFDSPIVVIDSNQHSNRGDLFSQQDILELETTTVGEFLTEQGLGQYDRICYGWDAATPEGIYAILKETGIDAPPDTINTLESETPSKSDPASEGDDID
jgi:hypothetical protein